MKVKGYRDRRGHNTRNKRLGMMEGAGAATVPVCARVCGMFRFEPVHKAILNQYVYFTLSSPGPFLRTLNILS